MFGKIGIPLGAGGWVGTCAILSFIPLAEFIPLEKHLEDIIVGGDFFGRLSQGYAQGILEELSVVIPN